MQGDKNQKLGTPKSIQQADLPSNQTRRTELSVESGAPIVLAAAGTEATTKEYPFARLYKLKDNLGYKKAESEQRIKELESIKTFTPKAGVRVETKYFEDIPVKNATFLRALTDLRRHAAIIEAYLALPDSSENGLAAGRDLKFKAALVPYNGKMPGVDISINEHLSNTADFASEEIGRIDWLTPINASRLTTTHKDAVAAISPFYSTSGPAVESELSEHFKRIQKQLIDGEPIGIEFFATVESLIRRMPQLGAKGDDEKGEGRLGGCFDTGSFKALIVSQDYQRILNNAGHELGHALQHHASLEARKETLRNKLKLIEEARALIGSADAVAGETAEKLDGVLARLSALEPAKSSRWSRYIEELPAEVGRLIFISAYISEQDPNVRDAVIDILETASARLRTSGGGLLSYAAASVYAREIVKKHDGDVAKIFKEEFSYDNEQNCAKRQEHEAAFERIIQRYRISPPKEGSTENAAVSLDFGIAELNSELQAMGLAKNVTSVPERVEKLADHALQIIRCWQTISKKQ